MDVFTYMTVSQFVSCFHFSDKTVRRRIADGSLHIFQPGGPGTKILIVVKKNDGTSRLGVLPKSTPPDITPQIDNAGVVQGNQSRKPSNLKKPRGGPKPRWMSRASKN